MQLLDVQLYIYVCVLGVGLGVEPKSLMWALAPPKQAFPMHFQFRLERTL